MRIQSPVSPGSATGKKSAVRGFSLVEIMVALVIGMIAVIVIMQVARTAEGQKRTTTGASDTQNNGALALYSLQRDVKQAGYGITSLSTLGCPLLLPAPTSHTLNALAPITINPPTTDVVAGDIDTDTLLVVYGSSAGSPEGNSIASVGPSGSDQILGLIAVTDFRVGQQVVAAPPAPKPGCALRMAAISGITASTVTVPSVGAEETYRLFNLGFAPRVVAYAVRSGNLSVCNYMQADCAAACVAGNTNCNNNWMVIAPGIVSLRAQYGRDTSAPRDGSMDVWDQQTPAQPSPANQEVYADSWAGISAVRLALVARNSQPERDIITSAVPVWAGSADAPVVLSESETDETWKHYRYQTYENVIPLRNIPWMGS